MSRFLFVPSAAFVASALVLSGCSGGGASTATSAATAPSSTAATSPSSDTWSATSSKPAPLRPTDPLELRGIDHTIAATPTGNLAADLAKYRAAIKGCSARLIGDYGSQVRLRLQPTPTGLGSNAVVAVSTSGCSSAERARIFAQVQKNVIAPPAGSAAGSSGAI